MKGEQIRECSSNHLSLCLHFHWLCTPRVVRGSRILEVGSECWKCGWPAGGGRCLLGIDQKAPCPPGGYTQLVGHPLVYRFLGLQSLCGLGSSQDLHNPTSLLQCPEQASTGQFEKPYASDGRHDCLEREEQGFLVFDLCSGVLGNLGHLAWFLSLHFLICRMATIGLKRCSRWRTLLTHEVQLDRR